MNTGTRRKIKVNFVDYFPSDDFKTYRIYQLLENSYDLIIDGQPDLLFYFPFGGEHHKYNCPRIFVTGENVRPKKSECDYSFSHEDDSENNVYYPFIADLPSFNDFIHNHHDAQIRQLRKTKKGRFCSFFYSNNTAQERIQFCKKLMRYSFVHCLGTVLRNTNEVIPRIKQIIDHKDDNPMGDWRLEKQGITKHYKFSITFENEPSRRYITEKILDALLVNSIPIYWGASEIKDYINPNAFINVADFESYNDCIEYIKRIDNDPDLYRQYVNAPPILPNSKFLLLSDERLTERLREIVEFLLEPAYNPISKRSMLKYYYYSNRRKLGAFRYLLRNKRHLKDVDTPESR